MKKVSLFLVIFSVGFMLLGDAWGMKRSGTSYACLSVSCCDSPVSPATPDSLASAQTPGSCLEHESWPVSKSVAQAPLFTVQHMQGFTSEEKELLEAIHDSNARAVLLLDALDRVIAECKQVQENGIGEVLLPFIDAIVAKYHFDEELHEPASLQRALEAQLISTAPRPGEAAGKEYEKCAKKLINLKEEQLFQSKLAVVIRTCKLSSMPQLSYKYLADPYLDALVALHKRLSLLMILNDACIDALGQAVRCPETLASASKQAKELDNKLFGEKNFWEAILVVLCSAEVRALPTAN